MPQNQNYSTELDGEFAYVYEMAGNGSGCSHDGADQVRAAVFALATFEIAVGGAGGALVRRKDVGVHANAHAATGVAPFESGFGENFVQTFFFSLGFNAREPGTMSACLMLRATCLPSTK